VYGWFSAGCHWNRETERALTEAGFVFERLDRARLSALIPTISGVARTPP
jgi:hypothetical protein